MQLTKDLRFMVQTAFAPIRGATHRDRLESFYGRQADDYDRTRRRLLPGRQDLMQRLPFAPGGVWIDLGGGTGANLEAVGDRLHQLKKVIIIDLVTALLKIAEKRILRHRCRLDPQASDDERDAHPSGTGGYSATRH